MRRDILSSDGAGFQTRSLPWLSLLFLTVVLFVNFHDLSYAQRGVGNYNLSADDLVASAANGLLVRRVTMLSLGIGAIISIVHHRAGQHFRFQGGLAWLLTSSVVWTCISPIWSDDVSLTIRRLVVFVILAIVAVAVLQRLLLREVIVWTLFSTGSYLLIGIVAEMSAGTFRPFVDGYRFAGSLHPNSQGIECGLLALSAMACADLYKRWRVLFGTCACFGCAFLMLTGSRTALAATACAVVAYLIAVHSVRPKIVMMVSLGIVTCVLIAAVSGGTISGLKSAALLGRDDPDSIDSFTGRTLIWEDISPYISQRPILGYGYGGFWTPSRTGLISDEEGQGVPNGHSAYLDYLLALGVVGVLTYSLSLLTGIARAFRLHRLSRNPAYAFCGALLAYCAVDGLLESATVEGSMLLFLCMVVLTQLAFVPPRHNGLAAPELEWGYTGTLACTKHTVHQWLT